MKLVLPRSLKFTPAVYPHYNDFTGKLNFHLLNQESQSQAKNIPVVLPSSPIKIRGKSVKGFLSYDRTNKQPDRQTNKDYIFIYKDYIAIEKNKNIPIFSI